MAGGIASFFDFYPRSPCGERLLILPSRFTRSAFLSTLSLRRATHCPAPPTSAPVISIHALLAESDLFLRSGPMTRRYFYPRSPCGERPGGKIQDPGKILISIHALLAESDRAKYPCSGPPGRFLSTLSLRRATQRQIHGRH